MGAMLDNSNITIMKLGETGWSVRGQGDDWAIVPRWPCSKAELMKGLHLAASDEFVERVMQRSYADGLYADKERPPAA